MWYFILQLVGCEMFFPGNQLVLIGTYLLFEFCLISHQYVLASAHMLCPISVLFNSPEMLVMLDSSLIQLLTPILMCYAFGTVNA
jgi:hypothetical protein